MLRFQYLDYLWLLLIIPLIIGIYLRYQQRRLKQIQRIGESTLVNQMMPLYSRPRAILKMGLITIALGLGVIGLANLQSGTKRTQVTRKGIDVMIALDVSKSMLAEDVAPNRLEKAKQCIQKIVDKIGNNRIGLIVFAGRAYLSVPLTVDLSALKMNLTTASPDLVPTQGTVLGEAIAMARQSFNTKDAKYKSIILISDGEDHDEDALKEVRNAVDNGITIHTLGVGSDEGAPILDQETGQNKVDKDGQVVISKLNEEQLQKMAEDGGGIYVKLNQVDPTAELIAKEINSSEQRNFGDSLFTDYQSYFQYFLGITLLLILVEYFLPDTKMQRS